MTGFEHIKAALKMNAIILSQSPDLHAKFIGFASMLSEILFISLFLYFFISNEMVKL